MLLLQRFGVVRERLVWADGLLRLLCVPVPDDGRHALGPNGQVGFGAAGGGVSCGLGLGEGVRGGGGGGGCPAGW